MRLFAIICLAIFLSVVVDACCKKKTIGYCCGNGPCNIFCCNCDGGCNPSCETDFGAFLNSAAAVGGVALGAAALGRKKRDVENFTARVARAAERFAAVDVDSNGAVSLAEATAYLELHGVFRREIDPASPTW